MAKPFVTWKLTEDGKDYYFQAPEGHYNGAVTAANTGVVLASSTEAETYPSIKVEALLRSKVATRRQLGLVIGTGATAKRTRALFVIATSKSAVFDALNAGSYTTFGNQTAAITRASERLRASFS